MRDIRTASQGGGGEEETEVKKGGRNEGGEQPARRLGGRSAAAGVKWRSGGGAFLYDYMFNLLGVSEIVGDDRANLG